MGKLDGQVARFVDCVEHDEQIEVDAAADGFDSEFRPGLPCENRTDMQNLNMMKINDSFDQSHGVK